MPIKRTDARTKEREPGIKQDGPNRFLVRVDWTDPQTGKRVKREKIATSYAAAVELRTTLKGAPVEARRARARLRDFATQWLEDSASRLAPSTADRYAVAIAHVIDGGLGDHWVDAISPADVRRWQTKTSKGVAAATSNGWLRVLRLVLESAVTDGLLARNPARAVKALGEGRTKGRRGNALDASEFRRTIDAIRVLMSESDGIAEDVGRMLLAIAWTGMRRGVDRAAVDGPRRRRAQDRALGVEAD